MARPLEAIAAQPQMRERVRAYPGTLTYLDLIAKNKRSSTLLMIFMVILAMLMGCVIVAAVVAYGGASAPEQLVPSAVMGGVAGLGAALVVMAWSWFGGASAILSMSGARPITPEEDLELYNVVEEMAIAAGLPMPRVFIIEETALNAFATGRDPQHAAVAITSGLRARLNREELQGVIAHEMAHVRHLDIRFAMLMATMVGLIVFAADAFWRILRHTRPGRGGRRGGKDGGGAIVLVLLILAIILSIVAPIVARMVQMAYSREREYLADAGAVELTRNPEGLASALAKLADDNEPLIEKANRGTAHLFIVNPLRKMREAHQRLDSMFASHPPIQERIARLMALAR
ncbi:MAG TPA: M48 family metallopeptidase [Phycisphaerales bacterium]|nr:M48 family metallopeptidase [Phycisphaerales bacterium]